MTTTLEQTGIRPHPSSQEFHWTADRFYRAADAGVFDDPGRLELIHGRILEKMPQSPLHAALIGHVAELLRPMTTPGLTLRVEGAIHIAFDGEPIPDIAVVAGRSLDYVRRHPAPEDVRLLVEVAVSSVANDLGAKALLYAQAGIGDYWVVLPEAQEIVVHRVPTQEGYRQITQLGTESSVALLATPEAVLSVHELLGRPAAEATPG